MAAPLLLLLHFVEDFCKRSAGRSVCQPRHPGDAGTASSLQPPLLAHSSAFWWLSFPSTQQRGDLRGDKGAAPTGCIPERRLGNTLCLGNFLLPNLGLVLHPVLGLAAHWARLVQHSTARLAMAWYSTAQLGMAQHSMAHLTAPMLLAAIPGELLLDSIPVPPGSHGRFGRMLETLSHEPRTTGRRLEIGGEAAPGASGMPRGCENKAAGVESETPSTKG